MIKSPHLYEGIKLTTRIASLDLDPYLPSPKLIEAVKLAQILKRPLLVKGEPGCGKSRLAEAIAYELNGSNYKNIYFPWFVKSISKAQEGLYNINYLQRLSDANINKPKSRQLDIKLYRKGQNQFRPEGDYIKLGVIGQAFVSSWEHPKMTPVILIDEIDKADIDFPNDLLIELDKLEFHIPEILHNGKPLPVTANPDNKPLIIITSNDEKPLPAAFLRRCLFHYINFDELDLEAIIQAKFPQLSKKFNMLPLLEEFKSWRDQIRDKGVIAKNISTSELLDWLTILNYKTFVLKELNSGSSLHLGLFAAALLKDEDSVRFLSQENPGA